MNYKHIVDGLIGISLIAGWNIFLAQRDEKLYSKYYYSNVKR